VKSAAWRCASCCCRSPTCLLLDEPTNHLDAETTAWLEKHLRDYPGAVLIITHDRYFLDNVTGWILELDRGRGIPYEGNYSAYLEAKAKRMAQEGREEASRQKALEREREWIAASPKARQTKSKARINAYEELLATGRGAFAQRRADRHSGGRAAGQQCHQG
jgi:ATPase subunit of ABC transporter with duplicated ATPase domains